MAEARAIASPAWALGSAAAVSDLGADLRAVLFQAAEAAIAAASAVANLAIRATCRVVVQTDACAAAEAVAVGISRAAALRLVTAACATEPPAANRVVPVAALAVALDANTVGNRRLGGAGTKDGRPRIPPPGGVGVVETHRTCSSDSAESEQGFQQGTSRAAPSKRARDSVEPAIVHRVAMPFWRDTIEDAEQACIVWLVRPRRPLRSRNPPWLPLSWPRFSELGLSRSTGVSAQGCNLGSTFCNSCKARSSFPAERAALQLQRPSLTQTPLRPTLIRERD